MSERIEEQDELEQAINIFRRKFPHAASAVPYYAPSGMVLLPGAWNHLGVVVPIDGEYVIETPLKNRTVPWLAALFEKNRGKFLATLAGVSGMFDPGIFPDQDIDGVTPYFPNGFFGPMDAVILAGFIGTLRPHRYIEIGSGNSTRIARWIARQEHLPSVLTCIDPAPRKAIDQLADHIVADSLLNVPADLFANLEENDILFFDGSHLGFSGTDSQRFFLEILPVLPIGVYVHIHDIFLPEDYPPRMTQRYYAEQHLLAAFLFGNRDFEVVLPVQYLYRLGHCLEGVSFWIKRVGREAEGSPTGPMPGLS